MKKGNGRRFLAAFDVDGTLLRSDNSIGRKTAEVLATLAARGNVLSLASGRPLRMLRPIYDALAMNGPIVAYNGVLVVDPKDPAFLPSERLFPRKLILSFLEAVGYKRFDNVLLETKDRLVCKKPDPVLESFYRSEGMDERVGDVRENLDGDSYICILKTKDRDLDERLVKAAFFHEGIGLRFWGGKENQFSELYWLDVSKTYGMEQARKKLGFSKEEVVVVGDADNDVEMLTEYPHSIAMKNGERQVRERASVVSKFDNDHDGAALAVFEMIEKLSKG